MKIIYYGKDKKPVKEFIDKLPLKDRAKILACLKSLEDIGLDTPRVVCRQITGKLWEIKINASVGYRIFYVMIEKNTVVLLHGYKKTSQKAPVREMEIAKNRMTEVLKDELIYIK